MLQHLKEADILFITSGCKFKNITLRDGKLWGELDLSLTPSSQELAKLYPKASAELGHHILNANWNCFLDSDRNYLTKIEQVIRCKPPPSETVFHYWHSPDVRTNPSKKIGVLNVCYDTPELDHDLIKKAILTLLSYSSILNKRIYIPSLPLAEKYLDWLRNENVTII